MTPFWKSNRVRELAPIIAISAGVVLFVAFLFFRSDSSVVTGESVTREGLKIDFSITSVIEPDKPLKAGEIAKVSLKFTDSTTGKPVTGLLPAAWIDPLRDGTKSEPEACKRSAATYLSGFVGIRPMIDLNSYYIVVLNADPSIAVIDPIIGVRGITKLLTQVLLPGPPEDWARSADEKQVYVAMSSVNAVSFVDLDTFRIGKTVKVGERPSRIMVQPDGRYAWVGTTGAKPGVTVVDTEKQEVKAHIETGKGHHELVVTSDNRFALVSNRDDRTVSLINVRQLKKTKDFELKGIPISLAYSALSQAAYVADGETGEVLVLDPASGKVRATIPLEPGLGPMRITPDGRYGFVVNPAKDAVFVFDTANNTQVHRIDIKGEPFQIVFSRAYGFVRSLSNNTVSMIRLADIGGTGQVTVSHFEAGDRPPKDSPFLLPSDLFATAVTEASTIVVSPGDANVFYYMEGMNAPMGSFGNYGHRPLSAIVADRTIKEAAPGEYISTVKIPSDGNYQMILTLDSPQLIECFDFAAAINPNLARDELPLRIAYETRGGTLTPTGQEAKIRFTLNDTAKNGAPYSGDDVTVLTFRAPGQDRTEHKVKSLGDGKFEFAFTPNNSGAYYIYPSVRSQGLDYSKLAFITIIVQDPPSGGGVQ
ncbi:YncE family protein [Hyphomonas sp.]|uniref:YncE family protein n=1 Tax=Hyphomonas sp. TaxID=87 RepID=UPI0025B837FD|nr:YncE family protein [Hyphomonas sp.]